MLPACASVPTGRSVFVQRKGTALTRGDMPYRIVGANMWYAAWRGRALRQSTAPDPRA